MKKPTQRPIDVVPPEIAEIAKLVGFDWTCDHLYDKSDDNNLYDIPNKNGLYDHQCSAPTRSILQRWIRCNYRLEIEPYRTTEDENGNKYGCQGQKWYAPSCEDVFNVYAKTHDEVFDCGLHEALDHIRKLKKITN